MKKIIILIAFLSISILASSQGWKKNEVDEFTGKTVRITKYKNVGVSYSTCVRFSIAQVNGYIYLQVTHTGGTSSPIKCKDDEANLILKFVNGETLTLKPTDEIDCDTQLTIYYPLQKDNFEMLKKYLLDKFRIYYTDDYHDYKCTKQDYFYTTLGFMGF